MICNKLFAFVCLAAYIALADAQLSSMGPNRKCAYEAYTKWWKNTLQPRPKNVNAAVCYNSAQEVDFKPIADAGGIIRSNGKHYCYDGPNHQSKQPAGYVIIIFFPYLLC